MKNQDIANQIDSQSSFIQYIRDNSVGGRNLSIRGLAELCGVAESSIREGAGLDSTKLAQKLVLSGFEGARLLDSGFCAQSAWLVIEYFAYESKAKAEGAKRLARLFGSIGVQTCFEMVSNQPIQPQRQLAPQRDVLDYLNGAIALGIGTDPLLKALITQRMAEELGGGIASQSKVGNVPEQVIVTVRAGQLGYNQKQIGNGSALGTFVKKQHEPVGQTYHGKYEVNVYALTPELDFTIADYFDLQELKAKRLENTKKKLEKLV